MVWAHRLPELPVLDISDLMAGRPTSVIDEIDRACRDCGFFYVVGHGVDGGLIDRLQRAARQFFALEVETKLEIAMRHGGRAWRGYFPVGGEVTSGRPDQKEGLYFGIELDREHPLVVAGTRLHGPNLFPAAVAELRGAVLDYCDAMTRLGHVLVAGIAQGLGLEPAYFDDRYTRDPLTLFRIFHYPALTSADGDAWSVGEHTDYGLLTILLQDECGGLQVKSAGQWLEAPPVAGSLVCNLGDMLDRMTGGIYRSTPHRVRNKSGRGRLSFPFFFDPNWFAEVRAIDRGRAVDEDRDRRWDGASVHEWSGTYGDYLVRKVQHVFPSLGLDVL